MNHEIRCSECAERLFPKDVDGLCGACRSIRDSHVKVAPDPRDATIAELRYDLDEATLDHAHELATLRATCKDVAGKMRASAKFHESDCGSGGGAAHDFRVLADRLDQPGDKT